jgi:hypothetical protein
MASFAFFRDSLPWPATGSAFEASEFVVAGFPTTVPSAFVAVPLAFNV